MSRLRPLLLLGAALLAGCVAAPTAQEPPNLSPHKRQIRDYVDTGQYLRDLTVVASRAHAWVEQRAAQKKPAERLAVVFDLDETLFFNWPEINRTDFGYVHERWVQSVEAASATAIEPVREVYRAARRLGVDVILLTGRREPLRAATERNLRAIDCGEYSVLICRPESSTGTSAAFKSGERQKLVTNGLTIIANIGDQESDLAGGFAEKTFKLPAPFYLTE